LEFQLARDHLADNDRSVAGDRIDWEVMAGTAQIHLPPDSDRVLAAALEAAAVLVVVIDPAGVPVWVNHAATEVTGFDRETLLSGSILERVAPEQRTEAEDVLERLWRGDLPSDYMHQWIARDGRRIRIRWRFSHLADDEGQVTHIVGVGIDITRQHMLGQARRAAEERFRLSFDGAPVGMAVVRADDEGAVTAVAVNRALSRMLGRHEEDLVGRDVADVTHPDDMPHERRWVATWVARGADDVFQYEKRVLTAGGEIVWAAIHLSLIEGESDGHFFLVHAVDITDRKRAQRSALGGSVDPLTGLLIEPAFLRELQGRVAADLPLSVVRLKLLAAEDVGAVHGYAARDELVDRGARRLNAALPPDARLARVGADEFAAFFKATGREALHTAKTALDRIAADPVAGTRSGAPITFAAGVAACEPGQHERAEALYTSAGVALEDALRGGTAAALSGRAARERAVKRLSWQTRLRRGLDKAGFLVHGQPVARLDTGAVEFTELSLRMHDEDGKLVFPAVFLPVAESTGMITAIDQWLLRRVRDLLAERPDERFAVRLSAATLGDRAAGDAAVDLLRGDRGIAERLIIEILGAENALPLRRTAHRLADSGCQLLLLNFGMAFGSLYHARSLPVTAVKIHGSFTRDIEGVDRDRALVQAVTDSARALGVTTIAEFVESEAASDILRGLGIDLGQGFHFGRPGPV
jgi:PAS domain S-box-containing protein